MLGGEMAWHFATCLVCAGVGFLTCSLRSQLGPYFMQSSPFAAREGGKHRARLCPVFLWRLAQSSNRERWRVHRWLRVGSFSSSASKGLSWEAPLFRASVLVHSRSDPHAPLCQLSAIFIHVLAELALQSVVTAVVPTMVGLAFLSVCFFTI